MQAVLDTDWQLLVNPTTGKIVHDGNITPIGGVSFTVPGTAFDKTYAVNTIFPRTWFLRLPSWVAQPYCPP
jgi:hypothetical protein